MKYRFSWQFYWFLLLIPYAIITIWLDHNYPIFVSSTIGTIIGLTILFIILAPIVDMRYKNRLFGGKNEI